MYQKISNLIYVLDLFSDFHSFEKTILFLELDHVRIDEFVNWNELFDLAIRLKFLKESNGNVLLTSNGNIFLSMHQPVDVFSDDQRIFVFKNGILGNSSFDQLNSFFELFSIDKNDVLELFFTEDAFQKFHLSLENKLLLLELKIITKKNDRYVFNNLFSEIFINRKIFGKSSLSQSELDAILDEQKITGDLGEQLTLKYEQSIFKEKKWDYQEKNVRIIGKKNVRAGYDVESFLTYNSKLDFMGNGDKHIEVKSRKYADMSFFISANELKIGKKLSATKDHEYLIYFWNNLGSKHLPSAPTKIIPFKKLKITPCKNCMSYLVEI
jgi:hypothetical protein